MKQTFPLLVCALLSACTSVEVPPGHEAVLVEMPVIFGHGGVVDTPVKPGRVYTWASTDYELVSMLPQQYEAFIEDLMSSDGVPLDFHASLRIQVNDSVSLIKNFGPRWYENNLGVELLSYIRQSVRKYGLNETAVSAEAIDKIDDEVEAALIEYVKESGLPVKILKVTVGKANPPDSVKDQRVATAKEQQRAITEHQRKLAEDARREAELARAASDNAYREAMRLDEAQFLELERIKMMRDVCAKGGTCTFFIGGEPTPVLPVAR